MNRPALVLVIILALALTAAGVYIALDLVGKDRVKADPVDSSPSEDLPEEPVDVEPAAPEPLVCTVGLYTGKGSWDEDVEALRNFLDAHELTLVEIDQKTISKGELNELCDILVFVGGWSSEYCHYIENHANIRSYVENGGCFVGFCAGAYYASSTMLWKGSHLDYPLKLFSGTAAGPLSIGWGKPSEIELNKEITFNLEFEDTLEIWYFDGPCFTGISEPSTQVLARYRDNGEAAVIAFSFGNGRVLLSGPHPELGFIPSTDLVEVEGGSGAQWPWFYAALKWLAEERVDPDQVGLK